MIIEITGEPGVGKTTVLREIYDKIKSKPILFSDDLVLKHFKLNFIAPVFLRRILTDILLFLMFLPHFKKYKALLFSTIKGLKDTNESKRFKMNILRNTILKFGRFEFISKYFTQKIVLVDEGISHIPFNLIDYTGRRNIDPESIFTPLATVVSQIKVIILHQKLINISHRLARRGHKRIKQGKDYSLEQFLHRNSQLVEAYRGMPAGIFLSKNMLELDDKIDYESIIHFFERTIEK
ncbi:MAG: hypothetical protein E3K32_09790 [wastewater metagenome]|nr:hypothetical protein [Candidatus Loosdrechtia aerotolerans]